MKLKKATIAHKNKPINRSFSATTLKVGAKESPDVGASIGGHGYGWHCLEKFLEPFSVIYFKKKMKTGGFGLFLTKYYIA